MDTETIDRHLAALDEHKDAWLNATFDTRLALLESLRANTARLAQRWVDAAVKAKGIDPGSPIAGEEWTSGPWALLEGIQHLTGTIKALRDGADLLQGATVRTRPDGQVVVRVHPANHWEKLLISGVEADVWMQPEVTADSLREHMAERYRNPPDEGHVALVLGAGNIASIPPLDTLYKLFAEGQVCLVKMNPVNDYLGPVFEEIFADFVDAGFVRFVYGGADVGIYTTAHALVEEIHITGSERTHDAIVYGVGSDGARRKEADEPTNPRRVTSELGGISPVIVVPGPWSPADLAFQAENIVTQKMHNGGFNCIASQVMVLPEQWELRGALLEAVSETFRRVPPRTPYYPGAGDRIAAVAAEYPDAEVLDPDAETPRLLIKDVDAESDAYCFDTEFFAGALAQTSLPGDDPETFLRNAIEFSNTRLRGTLGASILIHPKTERALGSRFESLLADLRYGTIGVNAWSGVNFLLPRGTWGAHPGHARNDIQSGIGVVHNALMFDKPQKTVVRAPWRPFPRGVLSGQTTMLPRPPWFVTNAMAAEVGKRITAFAADPGWGRLPGIFAAALRG
ncbi:MAG: aldehyde dehydrogenase family protein [Myxococcota bacterium]